MTIVATSTKALARNQLVELRQSSTFHRSDRLFTMLSFLVEETLAGRGSSLKELVIGDALYSAATPYDPKVDSAVRVEARRLRAKLISHYKGPGMNAPAHIHLPVCGYQPIIRENDGTDKSDALSLPYIVDLAIIPFRQLGRNVHEGLADSIADELLSQLAEHTGLRLASRLSSFVTHCQSGMSAGLRAHRLMHGTLRFVDTDLRVVVELSDSDGCISWSTCFEVAVSDERYLEAQVAQEVLTRLPAWLGVAALERKPALTLAS